MEFAVEDGIVGLGVPAVAALGREIPGLRPFPPLTGPDIEGRAASVPSTQQALWVFLRGLEHGTIFDASERVRDLLREAFVLDDAMDTFVYRGGRDLTGFEDGTENPHGDVARAASLMDDQMGTLKGLPNPHATTLLGEAELLNVIGQEVWQGPASWRVQRWMHNPEKFRSFPLARQQDIVGRELTSNEEMEDAPESAHVKRTAQESYDPEAFMVRRSMPFATAAGQGLEFIAFVASLDRIERKMVRMVGSDDGILVGLFPLSRPVSRGYYMCPAVVDGDQEL